jgi:pimeloyl-ACP methyl ester carboxylesterase
MKNWKKVKRIFIALVGLLLILFIVGLVYEKIARSSALEEFPPPGRMVSVGTHKLHLDCRGTQKDGYPTIILESGMDPWGSISWTLVHDSLAKITKVCAYDKAGIGWSEIGPKPRVGETIADELHELLARSGEEGPFVIVAWSMGGPYVRIFAKKYFNEIAGIVLVDSTHPEQFERLTPIEMQLPPEFIIKMVPWLRKVGIMRNIMKEELTINALPDDKQEALYKVSAGSISTVINEYSNMTKSLEQDKELKTLGDLPLIVLGVGDPIDASRIPNIDQETLNKEHKMWLEMQSELTQLSTRGELITVPESGHAIHLDKPDSVISAVVRILEIIKEDNSSNPEGLKTVIGEETN